MASKGLQSVSRSLRAIRGFGLNAKDPLAQCLVPHLSRTLATEAPMPSQTPHQYDSNFLHTATDPESLFSDSPVLTTLYNFPTLEPLRFEAYPSKHLHLPLRRDILHRAVIFEGDHTRQGTGSTKTRYEVHGSHRKMRPQKGTGRARIGTRQSPLISGGGKTFGPHPRDFATQLPKKMYDLAWRTALSWRYRRGELIICEDGMELEFPKTRYVKQIFSHNHWGQEDGRTLVITSDYRENLFKALRAAGEDGRAQQAKDVDVKDLLELGRVVVEKSALDWLLSEHESDLISKVRSVIPEEDE